MVQKNLKKVLIVEDSELQATMYNIIFAKYQSQLILVADGAQALQMLTAHTDIGMIITDVDMPNMTGPQFLQTARNANLISCPVIIISTVDNKHELSKAVENGLATVSVIKPWNMKEMWGLIDELVKN